MPFRCTTRGPLVELAQAKDAALIGITHYSKGTQGREPLERVCGSLAFGALARIVMARSGRRWQTMTPPGASFCAVSNRTSAHTTVATNTPSSKRTRAREFEQAGSCGVVLSRVAPASYCGGGGRPAERGAGCGRLPPRAAGCRVHAREGRKAPCQGRRVSLAHGSAGHAPSGG